MPLVSAHSVEVSAGSLMEAMALGFRDLRASGLTAVLPGPATSITVRVKATAIAEHSVTQYPSGGVAARVLLTAHPSVYTPLHESIGHRWREKEMIQPHPLV
jgi:hypothetical protein